MKLVDLPDELVVRILFEVFCQTGSFSLVFALICTNKRFYGRFSHLPYTWKPFNITNRVPKHANHVIVGRIYQASCCDMKPFTNLVSVSISVSRAKDLAIIPNISSSLKHLGLFTNRCHFLFPQEIRDYSNSLTCRFNLESFSITSKKPITTSKVKKLLGNQSIPDPWDKSKTEFGKYLLKLLSLNKNTLQLVQIELFDASLILQNTIQFANLKLLVFDSISVDNTKLWIMEFYSQNPTTNMVVHNSFRQILFVCTKWGTWNLVKNPRSSLDKIKRNLSILKYT